MAIVDCENLFTIKWKILIERRNFLNDSYIAIEYLDIVTGFVESIPVENSYNIVSIPNELSSFIKETIYLKKMEIASCNDKIYFPMFEDVIIGLFDN